VTAVLLGVELLDELASGIAFAGSPGIQQTFATSYATTAWVLLLVPAVLALVLEPIIFLAADRWPRRHFVRAGLAAMALSSLGAALAPTPLVLSLAVALMAVSAGTGVALAQATLVDLFPAARERVMTRWALMGLIGDLVGPALLAVLAAVGLGWRAGFAMVAAGLALWTLFLFRPFPEPPRAPEAAGEDGDEPGMLAALRLALGNRRLILWMAASAFCDLLDEILVVFASLHLRDDLGAGPTQRAVVLGAFIAGGAGGVLWAERLLRRHAPLRVLAGFSAACVVSYLVWLLMPCWWLSAIAMLAVGAAASPLYPITQAQAYAALPGRSGAVNAAGHLFTPLAMALPWLLGRLADHAGTTAALLVLVAEPLAIFLIAARAGAKDRAGGPSSDKTGQAWNG
jgi:predicted MFS family arabinose efflux permease